MTTAMTARNIDTPATKELVQEAAAEGLRYTTDDVPGIRRIRNGSGFRYALPDGKPVRDEKVLARIRSLAIPPAYVHVWICPHANGHLQATGRDARGRKQYRYHPRWREIRESDKYERVLEFGRALPALRRAVEAHLALPGLPREKVLATVVRLLECTHIRVGNEEYTRANGSYGLTTLRSRHAEVRGETLRFSFKGKSGVKHVVDIADRRIARIVRRCQELPGQELFQYVDDEGQPRQVDSSDVNDYIRDVGGADFTAKDFRTWAGTVHAVRALVELPEFASETEAKRNVVAAVAEVATRLSNTKAVCRKSYIHPAVLDAYTAGRLLKALGVRSARVSKRFNPERALLVLLRRRKRAGATS